jgi:hypothetical protein
MRISILILAFLLMIAVSNNQASVNTDPENATPERAAREKALQKLLEQELDKIERQRQIPAITAAFARRTTQERADRLAYLCFEATIDTPFQPIDLAEIALAETGGHAFSSKAVSSRGALGVWQLMPSRARSHGYKPAEMKNDEKCAEAAVKELQTKLAMAGGDLAQAKILYCGTGKQARKYGAKILKYRKEIMESMLPGESAQDESGIFGRKATKS